MKNKKNKKIIISIGIVLVLLVGIFGFSTRIDLTQEKRYTLTDSTIKTLKAVKKPMMTAMHQKLIWKNCVIIA